MIEVFVDFINIDKMNKGIQIGDHEIKTWNFADDTTIFLCDINCLNLKQVILKLHGNTKIN